MGNGILSGIADISQGDIVQSGNPQHFQYVATGAEGRSFTVTLPSTRADANYGVHISSETGVSSFAYTINTKTAVDFGVNAGAQLPVGAVLTILVEDLR